MRLFSTISQEKVENKLRSIPVYQKQNTLPEVSFAGCFNFISIFRYFSGDFAIFHHFWGTLSEFAKSFAEDEGAGVAAGRCRVRVS